MARSPKDDGGLWQALHGGWERSKRRILSWFLAGMSTVKNTTCAPAFFHPPQYPLRDLPGIGGIKLEPHRLATRLHHLFDAIGGHGGQDHLVPGPAGAVRRLDLSQAMRHAQPAHRGHQDGRMQLLPEQIHPLVYLADVHQTLGAQVEPGKPLAIRPQRQFVLHALFNVSGMPLVPAAERNALHVEHIHCPVRRFGQVVGFIEQFGRQRGVGQER